MSEVPSLWYDLGLNYYRQSSLRYPTAGEQSSQSLLLEKAQEVNHGILHNHSFVFFAVRGGYLSHFFVFSVYEKGYYVGQWKP